MCSSLAYYRQKGLDKMTLESEKSIETICSYRKVYAYEVAEWKFTMEVTQP